MGEKELMGDRGVWRTNIKRVSSGRVGSRRLRVSLWSFFLCLLPPLPGITNYQGKKRLGSKSKTSFNLEKDLAVLEEKSTYLLESRGKRRLLFLHILRGETSEAAQD